MSATNATTYYELPVFIATDKPAWLTDWNGAMNAIDTAIKEALTAGENAQTTANTATSSIATINDSLTTINTSLTTLTNTVTGLTGSVNTINSLIGNGEPTTSDKTLIGAINEIYAMIGGGTEVDADIVAYDNTDSGLTATNVQDAIDELATSSPAVAYDFDLSAHSGTATVTGTAVLQASSKVKYLLNADSSIGKIYGGIQTDSTNLAQGDNVIANIAIPDMPTYAQAFNIDMGIATVFNYSTGALDTFAPIKFNFKTDKSIDVVLNSASARTGVGVVVNLAPCVLFLENLGD